ncbi:MAG: hypothetical protein ACI892_001690, partial [Marinobacter maritimus]
RKRAAGSFLYLIIAYAIQALDDNVIVSVLYRRPLICILW